MNLTLHNFDSIISAELLGRGADYLDRDAITQVEELRSKDFNAVVKGSQAYSVNIVLTADDKIFTHRCSCPYDASPICKHKIALLMLIRRNLKDQIVLGKGLLSSIDEALDQCNREVLHQLILNLAKVDQHSRHLIGKELSIIR